MCLNVHVVAAILYFSSLLVVSNNQTLIAILASTYALKCP